MKTKSFFKFMLVVALYAGVATACNDDLLNSNERSSPMRTKGEILKGSENDNYFYKKKFAIALHTAMSESVELRNFIKTEALKMFNNDYDVLYNYVKDNEVKGTGKTLRDCLTPYFDKEDVSLDEIAYAVPLLTIFVPELPHGAFSAEKWECEKITPYVAVRLRDVCNEVPIFCGKEDDESFCLPYGLIPAFPVIVVKDNECVVLPDNPKFEQLDKEKEYLNVYKEDGTIVSIPTMSPTYSSISGDFKFKFSDIAFDKFRVYDLLDRFGYRLLRGDELEDLNRKAGGEAVREAWEKFNTDNSLYWQRDHIYYEVNQANESGRFRDIYHEFLTSFQIISSSSNPMDLIRVISDQYEGTPGQLDPKIQNIVICYDYDHSGGGIGWIYGNDKEKYESLGLNMSDYEMNPDVKLGDFWTEGRFKFAVDISMFPKVTDGIGGEQKVTRSFDASPNDLFDITYRLNYIHIKTGPSGAVIVGGVGCAFTKYQEWCYSVVDVKAKEFFIPYPKGIRPNIPWRLEDFSNQIKIVIEEVDEGVETTYADETSVTNNQNFEINFEISQAPFKVGGKYGASTSKTTKHSVSVKNPSKNDPLGQSLIFFGNDVIRSQTSSGYTFYKYSTGSCLFTFRPIHSSYWD